MSNLNRQVEILTRQVDILNALEDLTAAEALAIVGETYADLLAFSIEQKPLDQQTRLASVAIARLGVHVADAIADRLTTGAADG